MDWSSIQEYQWACETSGQDTSVEPARPLYRVYIQGPRGTVSADEVVTIFDRYDYIDDLYWLIVSVLDGHYHCCLTGRVNLL